MIITGGFFTFGSGASSYAPERVADPNMTTNRSGDVLRTSQQVANDHIIHRNIMALDKDERLRCHPRGGQAYSAIMDTRYAGGE